MVCSQAPNARAGCCGVRAIVRRPLVPLLTGAFEQAVHREILEPAGTRLNYLTRRKKDRPAALPFHVMVVHVNPSTGGSENY